MKTGINLITKRRHDSKKIDNRIFTGSVVLFSVCFLVGLAIIIYVLILKSTYSNVITEENGVKAKLSSLSVKKERSLLIKDRLMGIQKILSIRKKLSNQVAMILAEIPPDFGMESINANEKLISIRLGAQNLSEVDLLFEERLKKAAKAMEGLIRIDIKSFSQSGDKYVFTLDFHYQ